LLSEPVLNAKAQSRKIANPLPVTRHFRLLSSVNLQVGSWQKAVGNGLPSQPVTPPLTAYRSLITEYCLLKTAHRSPLTAHRLPSSSWQLAKNQLAMVSRRNSSPVTRNSSLATCNPQPVTRYPSR